jgi:hypothetical protein
MEGIYTAISAVRAVAMRYRCDAPANIAPSSVDKFPA